MRQLNSARRAQIVRCLVEGNSIRATVRMTGAAKNTVLKLLGDLGRACSDYQHEHLRNLNSRVVQVDEIWSFVGVKQKRATADQLADGMGDAWTWTALDADSKLIITWHVGLRTEGDCRDFIDDLADRCAKRIQLSSDGFGTYKHAVRVAFGPNVDYGQIVKTYGEDASAEKRYSPAVCLSVRATPIIGDPMESQISTSYVERQNLTMRMQMRRFTRLTNAFSKKLENHAHAIALHFMHYNFCRTHQTLKTTPAVAAGVADHVWSIDELIGLLSK